MTISADQFATHRLKQQNLTVEKAVENSWPKIEKRINDGFTESPSLGINVEGRERFPDHGQRVGLLLIKKLNDLGYWARVPNYYNDWISIKWSHKKPCSIFTWHPPNT